MSRNAFGSIAVVLGLMAVATWTSRTVPAAAPSPGTSNGEWPSYHGDLRSHHYSPLAQVDAGNFNKLEVAWRFKTDSLGNRPEYKLEGTPLMMKGVVYTTAGTRRSVVALDAATGELRWVHSESSREGTRGAAAPRGLSGRGLSYWTDGKEERILYVTPGYRLVALNARTGGLITSFGSNGIVDLKRNAVKFTGQPIDLVTGEIGVHSAPAVANDTVIIGSAFREGHTPRTHNNTKGLVQAFDVRTGKLLWIFNTIPRPGEFGNDTWENDSWAINGNVGVWNQISVDEELGIVYLPVETPTSDFYGGHRPGQQPVRRQPGRAGSQDGETEMAFPVGAPFGLELRRLDGADSRRHHRRRQADQSGFDHGQAGDGLRVRSRHRPAGLADRGAAGTAVGRAGRKDLADAAVSDQAPALRSSGRHDRPLDRLHARAASGSREVLSRYKAGPIFTPPVAQQEGGPDRRV